MITGSSLGPHGSPGDLVRNDVKFAWKVQRDVAERGWTEDQVPRSRPCGPAVGEKRRLVKGAVGPKKENRSWMVMVESW